MIKPNESDVNVEATLLRSVREGDREAFILLVRPWERAAFLAANAVVTNATTAEEIVQAAFLEALSSLRVLRPSGKFGVWLIQITIDRARKRTAEGDGKVLDPAQKPSIDDEVDYVSQDLSSWRLISSETLENTEHRLALEHAFVCLPQECREVLTLQDAAHLSHNETAEALGLSLRQVKARLRRARLQLRDALAPGNGGKWSNGSAFAHDEKAMQASGGATGLSPA
jgi:RNA polymerase sigma-70 factor (ECF subfamily)